MEKFTGNFRLDLQKFAYENSVMASAISYSIGAVTKDVISTFLDRMFIPFMFSIVKIAANFKYIRHIISIIEKHKIVYDIVNILWLLIIWLLTIILLYLLLEQFLNRTILGLQTVIPKSKQNDFIRSRLSYSDDDVYTETEKN